MKRVLFLVSILFLSSSSFSQYKRTNYLSYEVDAGTDDVIQVAINVRLNAYLVDDDNFQKYKNGQGGQYAVMTPTATNPIYINPPKKQHWQIVLDYGGRPFTASGTVRLFSLVKEVPAKAAE